MQPTYAPIIIIGVVTLVSFVLTALVGSRNYTLAMLLGAASGPAASKARAATTTSWPFGCSTGS